MNITSWIEKKTNEEVLNNVREKRDIMRHTLKRKRKLIGHLSKYNTFIWNIFEGNIFEKRSRGRLRTLYF